MRRDLRIVVLWTLLTMLSLVACTKQPETVSSPGIPLNTAAADSQQATLAVALTQNKNDADNQAAATAEIVRANAQTTLNAADATLSAAKTQQQSNADVLAAQIAGTAEVVRADAQATMNSAGATQSAALTQDAIRQTKMVDQATTDAQSVITQTAIANTIATQAAAATSQSDADEARARAAQNENRIPSLWIWVVTIFGVLFAGLALWGFWRWLRIQQTDQPVLDNPAVADRYQLTEPDDQVSRWLDEVKHKLLASDQENEDDHPTR